MIRRMKTALSALVSAGFLLGFAIPAGSQEADIAALETAFAASLKNATLTGSWIPVSGGSAGEQKKDSYRVVRAAKVEGDRWEIVSLMRRQGQEIEVPIPVTVKWAGDTAVMILDNAATGGGKSYSARVLFHNDRYAGSWWASDEPGGLLSGVVTRE